jgi:NADH-quinone oxidoreductase subunit B
VVVHLRLEEGALEWKYRAATRRRSARRTSASRQLPPATLLARLDGDELEQYVEERVITTTLDKAVAWARWQRDLPATFGLACCAIEMMSIVAARVDFARFGFEAFRASPRQADLLILSGRVSIKMAPIVRRIYDQMLEPKWAIAMGACSSSMGVFNNYAIVPADKFMPVDVHIPGCPPAPGVGHARASSSCAPWCSTTRRWAGASATRRRAPSSCCPTRAERLVAENAPGASELGANDA